MLAIFVMDDATSRMDTFTSSFSPYNVRIALVYMVYMIGIIDCSILVHLVFRLGFYIHI